MSHCQLVISCAATLLDHAEPIYGQGHLRTNVFRSKVHDLNPVPLNSTISSGNISDYLNVEQNVVATEVNVDVFAGWHWREDCQED